MNKANSAAAAQAAPAAQSTGAAASTPATGDAANPTDGKPAEEAKVDIFADLPRIKLADTDNVLDLSGVEGNNPFKYDKVHSAAVASKMPVKPGWKHSTAIFVPGTNKGGENGWKPTSVYGTIADIVTRAGRGGLTAHELVTQVRIRQIGNKRSKYCDKLPPVGWAEGWIDSAVTKSICNVHATKRAPALTVAPAPAEEAKPEAAAKAA